MFLGRHAPPFNYKIMTYKILLSASLISLISYLSYKLGKIKKELKYTKEENLRLEKELKYVQETSTLIHNLTGDDINSRLQQIASKNK